MPRRERPAETQRSEHWLRTAVNDHPDTLNALVSDLFAWDAADRIKWLSPIASDNYAEYSDQDFLNRLGITKVKVSLSDFWPSGGPRWDGLAITDSGRLILVEAKAYIEEAVDYGSRASATSLKKIKAALASAKKSFGAADEACWEAPFYQYANRLAHLYFLRELNGLNAYLLFLYFADAPDVPRPCSTQQWQGAARLTEKCLGFDAHRFRDSVRTLIWSVPDMISKMRR